MLDDTPNNKYLQRMLAHSKVAVKEGQNDMDSGEFDEVEDPDEEEESESRGVSPSGMTEAMERVEVGKGKAKQAEASMGKVDCLRVRINTNILQGVRSDPSEPGQPYGPRGGVGTKHGRTASDDIRGHEPRSPPPSSFRNEQEQSEKRGDEGPGDERRRSRRQSRQPDWYGRGRGR
jgi:hypothetical protein